MVVETDGINQSEEEMDASLTMDLVYWIRDVTRGFAWDSIAAITEDIERQYDVYYQEARARGLDDASAEESALQRLGSPSSARKRYGEIHPTASEESALRPWRVWPSLAVTYVFLFTGWGVVRTVVGLENGERPYGLFLLVLYSLTASGWGVMLCHSVAPVAIRRGTPHAAILSRLPVLLMLIPGMIWLRYGTFTIASAAVFLGFLALSVHQAWNAYPQWQRAYQKLQLMDRTQS